MDLKLRGMLTTSTEFSGTLLGFDDFVSEYNCRVEYGGTRTNLYL